MSEKTRIGIMISGSGTNMQAIVKACINGHINGEVVIVGSDNPEAKGLAWAKEWQIPTFIVDYRKIKEIYGNNPALAVDEVVESVHKKSVFLHKWFGGNRQKQRQYIAWKIIAETSVFQSIINTNVDLLVLAGFMQVCTAYLIDLINVGHKMPRIMNIHPALLPSFPGTDGYGDTIRYGCKVGGCTVHFVDYGEDTGPIIGQSAIPVLPGDTVETFRQRGLQEEYILYPECIQLYIERKLSIIEGENGRKIVKITETCPAV